MSGGEGFDGLRKIVSDFGSQQGSPSLTHPRAAHTHTQWASAGLPEAKWR